MFKKAKVVMLPTNEKAIGLYLGKSTQLYYSKNTREMIEEYYVPQNIFIISNDLAKENDWCIFGGIVQQATNNKEYKVLNKIIATTDTSLKTFAGKGDICDLYYKLPQPSQQFIEKYIEEYNKGNVITDVLVEYEVDYKINCNIPVKKCRNHMINTIDCEGCTKSENKLKINCRDNTITIKKIKDNWDREEVRKLCIDAFISGTVARNKIGTVKDSEIELKNMNIWLAENL